MKKLLLSLVLSFLMLTFFGQKVPINGVNVLVKPTNNNATNQNPPVVIPSNPAQVEVNEFQITSIGATFFSISNVYDGTAASSQSTNFNISVSLVPVNPGTWNFQLVFYSAPQAPAETAWYKGNNGTVDGILVIYYPISLYAEIKEKLNTALSNNRLVKVRVIETPEGGREGLLYVSEK
ncbi:MAG: hypothetical protein ICV66_10750 [Chitinophagaceae bacterium]|nr:hypothetical protein [Chitinophagaceae bacterium]